MSAVVVLSRKCRINPDNVATPIAASLGDLTTLALLSGLTTAFYKAIGAYPDHIVGDLKGAEPAFVPV